MSDRTTICAVHRAARAHANADRIASQNGSDPEVVMLGLLEAIYATNLAILARLAPDLEAQQAIKDAMDGWLP